MQILVSTNGNYGSMDAFQNGKVHLINVTSDRLSLPFKDGIDNDGDGEEGNPIVTQTMINQTASDALIIDIVKQQSYYI